MTLISACNRWSVASNALKTFSSQSSAEPDAIVSSCPESYLVECEANGERFEPEKVPK